MTTRNCNCNDQVLYCLMVAQGYFGYLIKNVNASKKIKEWLVNTLPFGYLENVILEKIIYFAFGRQAVKT